MNIETFLSAVGGALLLHFFPDKVAWVADWVFQGHIEVFSDYVQSTTMFLTAFMAAYFVVFVLGLAFGFALAAFEAANK